MNGFFGNNPYYIEYERLLKNLHDLIARGEGDMEEAEAVRDKMDDLRQQLSRQELDRLDNLSGDLYMLQDDEIFESSQEDPEKLRVDLAAALSSEDWDSLLMLLRKGPTFLSQDQIAYLRARAYEELGHLDTSFLFMQYAAKCNPQNEIYGLTQPMRKP